MWSFYFHELMRSMPFFLKGVWMTVAVAGLSLIFGTIIGFIAGIMRAGRNKPARFIVGVWVDLIRGTPFLVQVFIIFSSCPVSASNWKPSRQRLSH